MTMDMEHIKEVARQGADIKTMKDDIHDIKESLKPLVQFVHETRGGRKWIWVLLSGAGIVGGLAGAIIESIWK